MGALAVLTAPVRRRALQQQILAEQRARQPWQEAGQRRILQQSAAERVHYGRRPTTQHLDESRHAEPRIRPQVERIGELGVHPPQYHVDPLERTERSHPQRTVPHHQIHALHQRKTQLRRQIGLIERGLGMRTGTEHHYHRVVVGLCRLDQHRSHGPCEGCQGAWIGMLERLRDRRRHDVAIGQCVTDAGRRLRPVRDRTELPVAPTADIAGVQEQLMPSRHRDAVRGSHVTGVAEHHLRWKQPRDECPARAVDIGEHLVEHPGTLHQPGFQPGPIVRGDQQRDRIEPPRRRSGVLHRPDLGVGDAVVLDQSAHPVVQPAETADAQFDEIGGQLRPHGPHLATWIDQFVVVAVGGETAFVVGGGVVALRAVARELLDHLLAHTLTGFLLPRRILAHCHRADLTSAARRISRLLTRRYKPGANRECQAHPRRCTVPPFSHVARKVHSAPIRQTFASTHGRRSHHLYSEGGMTG